MIQLERAVEGDEFKDKEAFVTQAYRDQMAEVRRAEEEEKKGEGMFSFPTLLLIHHSDDFPQNYRKRLVLNHLA